MLKKFIKFISNRIVIVAMALLLQFAWFVAVGYFLDNYSMVMNVVIRIVSLLMVLVIVNKRTNPSYKLLWAILILVFPIIGIITYYIFGQSRLAGKFQSAYNRVLTEQGDILTEERAARAALEKADARIAGQSDYLRGHADAPLYRNTSAEYFAVGEDWFARYIEELKEAKHYIFLEYFIIEEGYMWDTTLDVLKEKCAAGLDVRLIYDDFGVGTKLPAHFYKALQGFGIKCAAFNPIRPILSLFLNNRDHRKITVIDGCVAFTGGINLADEYINQKERFGHWKDSGIYLRGEAVWSFTVYFLQMWSIITGLQMDFISFRPTRYFGGTFPSDGYIQPYTDSPMDRETVGENVYLNILNQARKYVYIFSPYLIPDGETMKALCLAAGRGVDVRIVTPGIPDKKVVFLVTQSYYGELLEAGVRIYQYTPGFLHSKSFLCDDEVAVVGSINVDYRSFFFHFECAAWMYRMACIRDIRRDCEDTFRISEEITMETYKKRRLPVRMAAALARIIAPLL